MTIRKLLENSLTEEELASVPTSFEIIGNREKAVAIVEIPVKLRKKSKSIAEAIMLKHKNVSSVLAKGSPRYGKYRKRKFRIIKGSRNTEVVHTENGLRFRLDPGKVYFSPRESTERARIANVVRKNEDVCVFFAGAGPFAITIAKKTAARSVTSIELNPVAVRYHKENNQLNKAVTEVIKKDVANFRSNKKFDRILMPLPEKSIYYVPHAIRHLKPKGTCHLYYFCEEGKEREVKFAIRKAAKTKKISFLRVQRVLPYGPHIWKMRFDFKAA